MPISPFTLNDSHRLVLARIRQEQPVTRAHLSRVLDIGSGPMTQLTRDLLRAGLIREGEPVKGPRGQPSKPLSLDPAGGLSFGVGLSPGRLHTVALDFTSTVVDEQVADLKDGELETVAQTVEAHIAATIHKVGMRDPSRVVGVGFAVPGFFFREAGLMHTVGEHATWRTRALAPFFSERLGFPAWIENDATAAALAEAFSPEGRASRSLVLLLINYGIGGGAFVEGRPLRGGFGNAGEIGAYYPLEAPRPSGSDLLAHLAASGIGAASLEAVDRLEAQTVLKTWTDRAAGQLASVLEAAWAWLDPDRVVVGGSLPEPVLKALAEALPQTLFALHPLRPCPVIAASKVGSAIAAIGAGCLPLYAVTAR